MKRLFAIFTLLLLAVGFACGQERSVRVKFDRHFGGEQSIVLDWSDGTLRWSATYKGKEVVAPSRLAMVTDRGVWGENIPNADIKCIDNINYNSAVVDFGFY